MIPQYFKVLHGIKQISINSQWTIHIELLSMALTLWLLNGLSMLTTGLAVADHIYLLLDLNPANLKIIGLYWLQDLINVLDTTVFWGREYV